MVTSVKQLRFSVLYLGHASLADRYSHAPGAHALALPAGEALRQDAAQLTAACRQLRHGSTVLHDDVTYRVASMHTAGGPMFVVSKVADTVYSLAELGIPNVYMGTLAAPAMSGLFIVAGPPQAGKTTTACALVKQRLLLHGGVAVTAERHIELPLEGSHGDGVCYQTVSRANGKSFSDSFRDTLRSGAQLIMVDEINDHASAAALLQASCAGHLIISTMVAASAVQAIARLDALLSEQLSAGSAKALLADGLAGVLHQQLRAGGMKRTLATEMIMLSDASQTRGLVRTGQYELLVPEMKQQLAAMIAATASLHRENLR